MAQRPTVKQPKPLTAPVDPATAGGRRRRTGRRPRARGRQGGSQPRGRSPVGIRAHPCPGHRPGRPGRHRPHHRRGRLAMVPRKRGRLGPRRFGPHRGFARSPPPDSKLWKTSRPTLRPRCIWPPSSNWPGPPWKAKTGTRPPPLTLPWPNATPILPWLSRARFNRPTCFCSQGKAAEAATELETLLSQAPDNLKPFLNEQIGEAAEAPRGGRTKAIAAYQAAVKERRPLPRRRPPITRIASPNCSESDEPSGTYPREGICAAASRPSDGLDGRPWLETLRLMAAGMGPQRPFQASLTALLRMLSVRHGFLRPHLVLFEPETGLLRLSLADTPPRARHADYSPGEGVTGQVFATGKPGHCGPHARPPLCF